MGLLLFAYLVTLLIRRPDQQWAWLDSWLVAGFEVVGAALCIARGFVGQRGRVVPLTLGLGLLFWAVGDLVLAGESVGGATPPTPSAADIFYLAFYPLAYVAAVLLLRSVLGQLARPNWLDGVVAGLGAAAVCAAFAFHGIVHATQGGAAAAATKLAYPIGDLLLLSLVVGGTALLSGSRKGPWLLIAVGITVNVAGDTVNLLQSSIGASKLGIVINDFAWPTSILLMSMAVWLRPDRPDPLRPPRVAGFLLPGVAAVCGLAILAVGTVHDVTKVALGLAIATLVTVGARLGISARGLRILTEENHRHAVTDELTGLGNRRQLFTVLDAVFAEQFESEIPERQLAFLFVDLNRFKEVNDSFGHPAGDELLRQLGPRLKRTVRSIDMVVRLGGDELAVVLMDADVTRAARVATRIVEELEEPFVLQTMSARVGASIGIALAPGDAADATGLLWCADVAMYRAKWGHAPFAFYDHDIDGGESQPKLLDELREAVEQGQLVLHYQPQLDLRSGEISSVEALLRWPHPRLGLLPPLKFLPLAEEAGLMQPLTELVLDQALAQCAAWRGAGHHLAVSVNVSTTNLLAPGFNEVVEELLERHRVPAEALVVEITETSVITDFEGSRAVIERLADVGIIVSIDDFGAGFTSLGHLSGLAVGELKLDRSFIAGRGVGDKERDLGLVRATIDLGHAMGLRVVAEGIEDGASLETLREFGCDLAQGYFISRPMPADKFTFRSGGIRTPNAAVIG